MAKVQRRVRADGRASYRVMWVIGGGRPRVGAGQGEPGSQASETFTDEKLMKAFKASVEAQDHQWPVGWTKGRGWVAVEEPTQTSPTLHEVFAEWLDAERDKIALGRKKPKSVGKDSRVYELHIRPTFGDQPFNQITRADVRAWIVRMSRLGAAPKSVHNRHGLMFQLMSYGCIEMGLRADNPCQKQPLPRDEYDRDIRFFNHGEWSVVRRCLRSDVHTMCDFALHTGVRWGELSALRVGDMTRRPGDELVFDVHITRAWSVRDVQFDDSAIRAEESETIKHKIGPTKTRKGRWVQVSGDLATTLLAQIAGKQQEEYVFTTARGNPWRYEDFYTDRWIPAMALAKEHGLNKHGTVHMLRHTYVVWLLADGEPIHVISVRLGHASIQITMDRYGGLLDLHDASSTKRMARLMAYAETAILPVALRQEEVDARAIRPGRRGDRRLRAAG